MYKNMADLTAENEYLVPDSSLREHDKKGDYLYLAILDQTGDDDENGADAQIDAIRKVILTKSKAIQDQLVETSEKVKGALSSSTEKFVAMLAETNLKGEMRVKQCLKKIEQEGSPDGKYLRESNLDSNRFGGGSRKGSNTNLADLLQSPVHTKSKFAR